MAFDQSSAITRFEGCPRSDRFEAGIISPPSPIPRNKLFNFSYNGSTLSSLLLPLTDKTANLQTLVPSTAQNTVQVPVSINTRKNKKKFKNSYRIFTGSPATINLHIDNGYKIRTKPPALSPKKSSPVEQKYFPQH